jgi:hypothetical protein
MVDDNEFLAAAQQIHDELGASELRDGLAQLVQEAHRASREESRQETIDQIYELLCRDESTRRRLDELLPPVPGEPRLGYDGLAGDPQLAFDAEPGYDRLACPQGDYAWPILDVADPTPPPTVCPHDGSPLAFRAAGG